MTCPFLKEVVMLYCDAYVVKKMIPLDRLVSTDPCLGQGWHQCPLLEQAESPTGTEPTGTDATPALSEVHR
jgi:hypothetical protein